MLERKIKTHDWSFRVNTSILRMCYVDSWRVYKGCQGQQQHLTQAEFYCRLADELIDNDYDNRVGMARRVHPLESAVVDNSVPRSGIGIHLTPTKRRGRGAAGARLRWRCAVCKMKSTNVCSQCRNDNLLQRRCAFVALRTAPCASGSTPLMYTPSRRPESISKDATLAHAQPLYGCLAGSRPPSSTLNRASNEDKSMPQMRQIFRRIDTREKASSVKRLTT
jgi:hypothetical protein